MEKSSNKISMIDSKIKGNNSASVSGSYKRAISSVNREHRESEMCDRE